MKREKYCGDTKMCKNNSTKVVLTCFTRLFELYTFHTPHLDIGIYYNAGDTYNQGL